MQLTRAADYAVRMMIQLATLPPGTRTNRAELAVACEIPEPFVGKILQSLARAGLISSHRGVNGGFALAKAPGDVSILNVVEAVEGPTMLNICIKPGGGCVRQSWCPAHPVWVEAQQAMTEVLGRASLASLTNSNQAGGEQWTSL